MHNTIKTTTGTNAIATALTSAANTPPKADAPIAAPKPAPTAKAASKPKAKPAKAAKAKPAPKAETAAPAKAKPIIHENTAQFSACPSPVFRGHGKKLSPVRLDTMPASFSERDAGFLRGIVSIANTKHQFKRGDIDAGALARSIGHGFAAYVSGDVALRDCVFAVTKSGRDKLKPIKATKA